MNRTDCGTQPHDLVLVPGVVMRRSILLCALLLGGCRGNGGPPPDGGGPPDLRPAGAAGPDSATPPPLPDAAAPERPASADATATDSRAADAGADTPADRTAPGAGVPDAATAANCQNLPTDVPYRVKSGPMSSEDFVFDRDGMLVSIDGGGRIWKTPFSGPPKLFGTTGLNEDEASGTRLLPNGDLVVAMTDIDLSNGYLLRILPDGSSSRLASGFAYPNGIEVDLEGFVYVADQALNQVARVDGTTGAATVLVKGNGLDGANGVTFSPDYRTLYIGSYESGDIYALEMKPDRTAGAMRPLVRAIGERVLDGLAVDECGNVYAAEFAGRRVYRVPPTGGTPELVADLAEDSSWIPNMQWGSGVGGWNPSMLYVMDRRKDQVYELDVRVRGKPVAHLP
jgi:sugar lactone lactonase YvrE